MMGGLGMGFTGIFWIAIVVVIIVLAVPYFRKYGGMGKSGDSALDILKQRYARGEIDKKEYEEKKRHLA